MRSIASAPSRSVGGISLRYAVFVISRFRQASRESEFHPVVLRALAKLLPRYGMPQGPISTMIGMEDAEVR
jgi:hypothetical protein